jgi:Carboxypeptidase regulatory-like domain
MTFTRSRNIGFRNQRGFWLRCFLTAALLFPLSAASHSAQLDLPKPERLTHVEGIVVDPEGHPAADLSIKLLRDDKAIAETRTDKSGAFEFERVPSGPYLFRVARSKFAAAARDIVVTDEIVTHLERKKLYVVLGPGACQDECSAVLTSKRDFDRTIRKNSRH